MGRREGRVSDDALVMYEGGGRRGITAPALPFSLVREE